jgi:outer membrane protein TolC
MEPAGKTVRVLLSVALAGAICIPNRTQGGLGDCAAGETNLPAGAAGVKAFSLKEAWAEAIASAHRHQVARTPSNAGRKTFSTAKASLFPLKTTDEEMSLPSSGESSSVLSLPVLMGMPAAQDDQFWAGRVIATVPVFSSGRVLSGRDAFKASRRAVRAGDRRETLDLKLLVAGAYVSVLRATRESQAAESVAASLALHLQRVSRRLEESAGCNADMLSCRAALTSARRREIDANTRLGLAAARFNRLLHRSLIAAVSLEDLACPPAPGDERELILRAFKSRPELAALSGQAEAFRQEAMSLRAGTMPSIGVSGSYNRLASSLMERDQALTAGVVVTWKLFGRGETQEKANEADDKADGVSVDLVEAMIIVSSQVHQASLELEEALQKTASARGLHAQAEERLTKALDRYVAGTGPSTEVLEAASSSLGSLGDCDNAIYDAAMAGFRLGRAVGDL